MNTSTIQENENENDIDYTNQLILLNSFLRLINNSQRIFNENYIHQNRKIIQNYYEHANISFKNELKDDDKKIEFYNKCCYVVLGFDENFIGRFTIDYLKKYIDVLKKFYEEIIRNLNKDVLIDFFLTTFNPILQEMYNTYITHLKEDNTNILDKYIICEKIENDNCSICMENLDDNSKKVKLDCGHTFHYNCTFSWFMEKQCCPICRKEFKDKEQES